MIDSEFKLLRKIKRNYSIFINFAKLKLSKSRRFESDHSRFLPSSPLPYFDLKATFTWPTWLTYVRFVYPHTVFGPSPPVFHPLHHPLPRKPRAIKKSLRSEKASDQSSGITREKGASGGERTRERERKRRGRERERKRKKGKKRKQRGERLAVEEYRAQTPGNDRAGRALLLSLPLLSLSLSLSRLQTLHSRVFYSRAPFRP